jgi:hypothetical protein
MAINYYQNKTDPYVKLPGKTRNRPNSLPVPGCLLSLSLTVFPDIGGRLFDERNIFSTE